MRREREDIPHSPIFLHGVHKDNYSIYVLQQGVKYLIATLKPVGSGLFTYVRVVVANGPPSSSVCHSLQLVNKMFLFMTKSKAGIITETWRWHKITLTRASQPDLECVVFTKHLMPFNSTSHPTSKTQ
jgi:hypothetical protein